MRKIKRSQNRHRNRMLASMASVALAITMMVNGAGIGIQPVLAAEAKTVSASDAEVQEAPIEESTSENDVNNQPSDEEAEKKSEEKDKKSTSKNKEIYLNGSAGSNGNDGTSPDNAVKTFTKAKKLAGKSGTIYVTGSITIHSSANWSLSGAKIKKAKGFNGPIVIVKPGAVLTLSTRFISEKDMELASSDCLVIKSEAKKEEAKKEETKEDSSNSSDNKTDNKKEETTQAGKTEDKKENKDETSKEPAGDGSKEEDKTSETKKKKAKDITTPSLLIMEKQQALSNLLLTNCKGDGIFYWADGSYVPDKYEDTCTIIFKPEDTKNYDYSDLSGWNEKRQIIKRKVKVRVESLKDADKKPEDSKEDTADKDTDKGQNDSTQSGNSSDTQTGKDTTDNTVSSNSQGSVSGNTQGKPDKENTDKDDPKNQNSTADNTQQNTDKNTNTNEQQNPDKDMNNEQNSEKDTNTGDQPNAGQEVAKPENQTPQEEDKNKNEAQVSNQDKTTANDIISMIQNLPYEAVSRADVQEIISATKAFEALTPAQKALIEARDTNKLLAAQESCRRVLLTSNGVSVSGDFLPWYVEFRASFKPSAAYEKEQNIRTILSSYELKLWNLLSDTEYKIPEGEKVKVKMKAPDSSLFDQCVIIHTLEDGSKEYITPVIEGEWLTFETRSFSPFDVAGSKVLAGALVGNNTTDNPPSLGSNPISPSSDSSNDTSKSNNSTGNSSTSKNSSKSSNSNSTSSNDKETTSKSTKSSTSKKSTSSSSKKTSNPQTGDTLAFLPYLFSAAGAMAVILFLYFGRRRVKK